MQFLERLAVARHQADADLQSLLLRLLRQRIHFLRARTVGDQRFLHEDIQPLFDRVFEMHPAESERRGEDRDVARLQAIHRLLVAVEADEFAIVRHIHAVGVYGVDRLVAAISGGSRKRPPSRPA